MSTIALIMAGGLGERARRSIGPIPKPLLPIRGVPLLERNLLALLGCGQRRITVSVSEGLPAVGEYVRTRGRALVEAAGGALEVIEETSPRGNIGCAAALKGGGATVLVVFVDNLTSLDLRRFLHTHRESGAALTIATHREPFRIPFGEVRAVAGRVVAYREKPTRRILVCSGIAVLGPRALDAIPEDRPMGISELAQDLLQQGEVVSEFRHRAPWIDVNDSEARARAERIIADSPDAFECWFPRPHEEAVSLVLQSTEGILLERGPDECWAVPTRSFARGPVIPSAVAAGLAHELGADREPLRRCLSFDDLNPVSRIITRYHVYTGTLPHRAPEAISARASRWTSWEEMVRLATPSRVISRALAALQP